MKPRRVFGLAALAAGTLMLGALGYRAAPERVHEAFGSLPVRIEAAAERARDGYAAFFGGLGSLQERAHAPHHEYELARLREETVGFASLASLPNQGRGSLVASVGHSSTSTAFRDYFLDVNDMDSDTLQGGVTYRIPILADMIVQTKEPSKTYVPVRGHDERVIGWVELDPTPGESRRLEDRF